jgi:hypothetical protein
MPDRRDREEDHHQRGRFFRMQGGRQVEHWGGPDMLGFLMQLGVMPAPGAPGPGAPA